MSFRNLSTQERSSDRCLQFSWHSAIETLAKLHTVDFRSVGLEKYGSHKDFYPRQIKSLGQVSAAQAKVSGKDDDGSEQTVGKIPGQDYLLPWYSKNCPTGELTIVHGDYKLDNFVCPEDR